VQLAGRGDEHERRQHTDVSGHPMVGAGCSTWGKGLRPTRFSERARWTPLPSAPWAPRFNRSVAPDPDLETARFRRVDARSFHTARTPCRQAVPARATASPLGSYRESHGTHRTGFSPTFRDDQSDSPAVAVRSALRSTCAICNFRSPVPCATRWARSRGDKARPCLDPHCASQGTIRWGTGERFDAAAHRRVIGVRQAGAAGRLVRSGRRAPRPWETGR
jgi:hypothetical protein